MKTYNVDFKERKLVSVQMFETETPKEDLHTLLVQLQTFGGAPNAYQSSPEGIKEALTLCEKLIPLSSGVLKIMLLETQEHFKYLNGRGPQDAG